MKRVSITTIFFIHIFLLGGYSQNVTTQDSIQTFADSLILVLQKNFLDKNDIKNWDEIKTQFQQNTLNYITFEEALSETKAIFDTIGCDHCMVFSEAGYYPATQKPLLFEDYSDQFVKKYASGVEFSVSKLENDYGYIVIPGMLFLDLPKDSIDKKAQEMYDQIVALDTKNKLKGWIIDLRFDIGGDAYLMITGLYHLLGNKVVYKELDINKNVLGVNQLIDGKFYSTDSLKREIEVSTEPDLDKPIALIIGNWTASAGEDIILGFKDRKNVLLIGQPTYGFLTGNEMYKLPFNVQAAITMSYIADMYGHYSENIEPNIYIKKKDNFDNLLKDQNIIEAIKFIDSKN